MTFFPKINEPSRGNPDLTIGQAIVEAVKAGNPHYIAAGWAGIWPQTLTTWLTRGANELARIATENLDEPSQTEEPYVTLTLDLFHYECSAEARMSAQWQGHFGKDWRAVERFMMRRWPERWAPKATRVELSGPDGGPVPVAAAVLSLDEVEQVLAGAQAREALEVGEALDAAG